MGLVRFEMAKIWCRKAFLAILMFLVLVNLVLQWYGNRETKQKPGLQAYRKAVESMAAMTEQEKYTYLQEKADELENLRVTDQIAMWMGRDQNTMEELSAEHQEIFKKWYPVYRKGDFLTYTDSLDKEIVLIDELLEEAGQVTNYGQYLQEMQESQKELTEISIFSKQEKDSFSKRNIKKSQNDYKCRTASHVKWTPSKGIVSTIDNQTTGIFLLISTFLFAVWGIMEEKEKRIFFISRATVHGILEDICARIVGIGINCILFSLLLYGSNYLFYGITTGFGDLSSDIQSVSAYMQSCQNMSIGQFLLCSVLTKAVVVWCFGLLLQCITILSRKKIVPFLAGILILAGNVLLYELSPSVGVLNPFKYINLLGVYHTENIYGDYLNFNIYGYPVSRTELSLVFLGLLFALACILNILIFCRGNHFSFPMAKKRKRIFGRPFFTLFGYESYKILIGNRALLVLLVCVFFSSLHYSSRSYPLSAREQYYQDLMMELEGELTADKEQILQAEQKRYEDAYAQLEQIAALEEEGKLGKIQAEEQREQWKMILFFYPSFQRAWKQYERIRENGGRFLYDTGYLYLFGVWGGGFIMEFLFLEIGLLLAFSHSVSMEYQNHANLLICSSKSGIKRVICRKICLCLLAGMCLPLCMWIYHGIHLQKYFPMHGWSSSIQGIFAFQKLPAMVPIWLFVIAAVVVQALVCSLVALSVLLLSYWRKNFMQAVLIGMVLFLVPLALYVQGIRFMKWLTLYPWYISWIR